MDKETLFQVLRVLEEHNILYKIVGGVALNIHGIPRATQDLDIFVKPDHENIRKMVAALKAVFKDDELDQITSEDLAGRYPAIQYVPPDGAFYIDILARLGEAFRYEDIEAQRITIGLGFRWVGRQYRSCPSVMGISEPRSKMACAYVT
jgi:hypothetical protein